MGSRERKRAERRKRKERAGGRREELQARREAMAARTEAKNQAAREALEPLAPDERPTVVTVAAAISAVLALGTVIAYAVGLEVGEIDEFGTETGQSKPNVIQTVIFTALLTLMAYGLWRARYWAVLGFQTLLVLWILLLTFALIQVTELVRALVIVALLAGTSMLFYRMVKAMARIQMPER